MIYLARNGKRFGPFHADELTPQVLSEYSWILDLQDPSKGWQPLDPMPVVDQSIPEERPVDALAISREGSRVVAGELQAIRLRSGLLVTQDHNVRLEPGTTVQILVEGRQPFPATIDRIDFDQRIARYQLRWSASHAPG
jgi:hypothetical protein